ncbi:MAG TPA: GNAT family acetyltransferase [Fimbriimonas sp.]|nr:GNAT family acetyltransferase [Fimbriimonas sp.]
MEIRPITEADIEEVVGLWRTCELARPWNDPYVDIRDAAGKERSEVFVGTEGDRLVASAMAGYDGHRGWIYYVSVAPDCQGRGLGKQIMGAAEAFLVECGARKIMLMVRESNLGVIEFYHHIGFKKDPTVLLGKFVTEGPY